MSIVGCSGWFVNPDAGGGWIGNWRPINEPFRVNDIGGVENGLALGDDEWRLAMVERSRGQETDPGMVVFFVVPTEEVDGEDPGVLDGAKAIREAGPVFQGTELTF